MLLTITTGAGGEVVCTGEIDLTVKEPVCRRLPRGDPAGRH